MSVIRQVLTGRKNGRSTRELARMYNMSRSTVQRYIKKAGEDPLGIDGLLKLEDQELDRRFNPGAPACRDGRYADFLERVPYFRRRLSEKHMTVRLLWEEYVDEVPDGYGLTQFRHHLTEFVTAPNTTAILKIRRKPAEDMFVDFAGDRLEYVDLRTGERVRVETFVAVLPYSGMTYVLFVPSQRSEHFLAAVDAAIRFFGGAPRTIVPDNLRSAVKRSDRWSPEITDGLNDLASHYGCNVDPARPYKPRDKALAEDAVNKTYMRIYAPMGKRTFNSIDEMNEAAAGLLEKYNGMRMQGCEHSRLERFLTEEKPLLLDLPAEPFRMKRTALLKVMKDGTVQLGPERHHYSVPYRLVGKQVEVSYTVDTVRIFHKRECVAAFVRSFDRNGYTIDEGHLSPSARAYGDQSAESFIASAAVYGEAAERVMRQLFSTGDPSHLYKPAKGILRLAGKTDPEIFLMTCEIALEYGKCDYRFIESMVTSQCRGYLSVKAREADPSILSPAPHSNIRGPQAFK